MSCSRNQLNEFLAEINIQDKIVMDIGVQDKPTSRLTKGIPKAYYTLDIDPQWNPGVIADINDSEQVAGILWKTARAVPGSQSGAMDTGFDVVFCIEVLEHCWDPVRAVGNMSSLLKKDGTLYLSTPFINPHHDYVDYLRYTNQWYEKVLPMVGFSKVIIHERVATEGIAELSQFFRKEGLRVSKIRPEYGRYTYPIGYFVEAHK